MGPDALICAVDGDIKLPNTLPISLTDPDALTDVTIVQHANASPIAMSSGRVLFAGQSVIVHLATTVLGSSGSPVFSHDATRDAWSLVGVHTAASDKKLYRRHNGRIQLTLVNMAQSLAGFERGLRHYGIRTVSRAKQ